MRNTSIERSTNETNIFLELNLDGTGKSVIDCPCGFLTHMLTLFASHGKFDIKLSCQGDVEVDDHHTVEDVGIVLGQAFAACLGEKRGVFRYGSMMLPMDEALVLTAVDLSGRSCLAYELELPTEKIGTFDCELLEEFWFSFVRNCPMSLHIKKLSGKNSHHIAEASFKSAARSLRQAVAIDPLFAGEIPSTKGVL